MRLIEALKRLNAIHLKGESSYEKRRASQHYGATYKDLFDLRVSLSTDDTFLLIERFELAAITQALVDAPDALELFIVSELQRMLDSILALNVINHQYTFKYWEGWLDAHREDAETLRKDMNL